nr:hypothetical transcript [Hymenolepis microstoma]
MSGSFKFNCTPDSAPKNPTPITPVTNGYSVLMPTLAATKNTCLKSPIKCWTSATPESAHRSYGGKRGEKDGHDIGPTRNSIKKTDRTPTIKAAKLTSKGSSHYDDTSKIASSTNSTPSVQGYSECTPHKSPKSVKPFKSKSADYIRPEVTIPQKSKSADAILRVPKEASKHEETKGEVKPPSSSVIAQCRKLIEESKKPCPPEPSQPVNVPQVCEPENVPTKSESCMETSQASSKQNEDNLSKPLSLEECQKLINEPLKQCDSEPAQPENVQEMDVPTKIQSSTEGDDINDLVASPDSERDHLAPNLDGADTHSPSPGKSNLTILPVNSQTPRQMSPIGHPHLDNQQDKITISINCSISEKINSVHLHYEGPKSAQREERNEEDTSVETDVLSVEYTERSKELRWGVEHRLRQESEELVNMTDEDESISNIDK